MLPIIKEKVQHVPANYQGNVCGCLLVHICTLPGREGAGKYHAEHALTVLKYVSKGLD